MPKYRKKPVVIEAIRWNHRNFEEIDKFTDGKAEISKGFLFIHTLEGRMMAEMDDYIIKGIQGECYPCKPDIFEQTYEKV